MSFVVAALLGGAQEWNRQLDAQAAAKAADEAAKKQKQADEEQFILEQQMAELNEQRAQLAELNKEQRGVERADDLVKAAKNSIPAADRDKYRVFWDGSKVSVELLDQYKPKKPGEKTPTYGARFSYSSVTEQPSDDHAIEFVRIAPETDYNTAVDGEALENGTHYKAWWYDKKGGSDSFRAKQNMGQLTQFLFDEGALADAMKLKDETGDDRPLNELIRMTKVYWGQYTATVDPYELDEKTAILPSITEFDPRFSSDAILGGTQDRTFFDQAVYPTFDSSLYSVEQAYTKLGLPRGTPVDTVTDESGTPRRFEVPVQNFANLNSWAVEGDEFRGDVADVVYEISRLSEGQLKPSDVLGVFDELGPQKGREYFNLIKESRSYFMLPENELVQYSDGVLTLNERKLTTAPFYNKLGEVLTEFDQSPDTKMAIIKAVMGEDVINKLPGKKKKGDLNRAQQVALQQLPSEKGVIGLQNRAESGYRLSDTLTNLVDLIEKEEVVAGIAGGFLIKSDAFFAQGSALINAISPAAPPMDASEDQIQAYNEFNDLKRTIQSQGRQVNAEVFFRALSRAALYDVASMLQGGDFRNISDYDVKLAGDRLGGIFDNLANLKAAVPALKQLRDDSREVALINDNFATGSMADVAAASVLLSHRRGRPRSTQEYLDTALEVTLPRSDTTYFDPNAYVPLVRDLGAEQLESLGF